MVVDHIHRSTIDLKAHLNDPAFEAELNRGDVDINRILRKLPAGVTKLDILEYLKERWVVLDQTLFQNSLIKAEHGSVPPPDPVTDFAPISKDNALLPEDQEYLLSLIGSSAPRAAKAVQFKAVGDADPGSDEGADAPEGPTPEELGFDDTGISEADEALGDIGQFTGELTGMIESHEAERQDFLIDIENAIFNNQLTLALESKREELRKEFRKIMELLKSGAIQPEFVLIALAKIQSSERGFMFTQMGQRMMHVNDEIKSITDAMSSDMDIGGIQAAQNAIREKGMSLQQTVSVMQKLVQDIDGILSTAKSMVEEYNRTKVELQRKLSVSG